MFTTIIEAEQFFHDRRKLGIKPGLERMEKLLDLLGSPEKKFACIHIAGTNGKGSTMHYIQKALQASGYQISVFTSPSFHGLLGHIYFNDHIIREDEFLAILNDMLPLIKKLDTNNEAPTEYEILAALAYMYFTNHGDLALIETGMGGRFDMTNTCQPILSIITNVSCDHTDYLGNSLTDIAYQKAGIIKKKTPVLLGEISREAFEVILNEADVKNADVFQIEEDVIKAKKMKLKMSGNHQVKNANLAILALKQLEKRGYTVCWEKALAAIENTALPGRFEILSEQPLVIADAAHNPAGVKVFLETIDLSAASKHHLIVAMFADKDIETMLQLLSEQFEKITVTTFNHPRAASVNELDLYNHAAEKQIALNWQEVMNKLMRLGEPFYITGSLHFITLVRAYFKENYRK